MRLLSASAAVLVALTSAPALAAAPPRLTLSGGAQLPYHASHSLSGAREPTSAVVVVHGTGRNAKGYYDRMVSAAGGTARRTVIIAPHFQTKDDRPAPRDAYWANGGAHSWKDGGDAEQPRGLSSFTAMDELLRVLADKGRFPSLGKITLVGHSAGGQFAQRYAAGSRVAGELRIGVGFAVANPSSYLYLSPQRPLGVGSCREYDDYKYGLQRRNPYLATPSAEQIRGWYGARRVTYLLGERDTERDGSLDTDCPAEVQGRNRFERGSAYFAAIQRQFPAAPHRKVTVPGVGHDSGGMFSSAQGRTVIFG
ncbi:hypothetical protein N8J89_27475 [Crossiella sp. CA-258035]|uniref:alpha/beta fold hydrolase n=1 Tax=Crossiella sp. CA-258035 TaxID=2981138 RepID=UPI0024BC6419|nr:hypothetical protein [Crossiella sp. CA-258035]WHT16861.1 hypothetical protein N8J89_27475 [Crossiella sp. CA-258035]